MRLSRNLLAVDGAGGLWLAGMTQALDELFLTHRKTLVWRLLRLVRCRHTAEDLVQETYVRVARALDCPPPDANAAERRPVEHLQPFLYQTARNVALDHLRREKVRQRVEANDAAPEAVLEIPSPELSPEAELMDKQRLAAFERVIAALPERAREMLVLSRIHGWTYPRIAEHLGVSQSTVYNVIRAALAQCLAETRQDPP